MHTVSGGAVTGSCGGAGRPRAQSGFTSTPRTCWTRPRDRCAAATASLEPAVAWPAYHQGLLLEATHGLIVAKALCFPEQLVNLASCTVAGCLYEQVRHRGVHSGTGQGTGGKA